MTAGLAPEAPHHRHRQEPSPLLSSPRSDPREQACITSSHAGILSGSWRETLSAPGRRPPRSPPASPSLPAPRSRSAYTQSRQLRRRGQRPHSRLSYRPGRLTWLSNTYVGNMTPSLWTCALTRVKVHPTPSSGTCARPKWVGMSTRCWRCVCSSPYPAQHGKRYRSAKPRAGKGPAAREETHPRPGACPAPVWLRGRVTPPSRQSCCGQIPAQNGA